MQTEIISCILVFIFGLIMGSFLNVVISRLKIEKSGKAKLDLSGRSHCPHCQKTLEFYELIPIFSYFILGRKCSRCKKQISWQYPVVELVCGILTLLPFYLLGFDNLYAYFIIPILYLFIIIFFYDLKHSLIPDIILLILFVLVIIFDIIKLVRHDAGLQNLLFGFLIGGGLFLALVYFSKEKWMGWGDVKLGFILGLLLLYPYIIVSHFIAFIAGALVSLWLISCQKKCLKSEIPFAPFLVLGAAITLFFGAEIINWYLKGM